MRFPVGRSRYRGQGLNRTEDSHLWRSERTIANVDALLPIDDRYLLTGTGISNFLGSGR